MVERGEEKGLVRGTLHQTGRNLTWILERRRRLIGPVLTFEAWFSILAVSVMVPAIAWLMNRLVVAGGGVTIGNTEMVGFFLSVPGLIFLVLAAGSAVTFQYAEYAGLLVIIRRFSSDSTDVAKDSVWRSLVYLPALALLGVIQVLGYGIGMLPWLGGCLLIKSYWLGAHDINFYLSTHPPEWYVALAVAVIWTLPWLLGAVGLFVRWLHAVPLIVFEGQGALSALAISWQRSRGTVWLGILVFALWNLLLSGGLIFLSALIRWAAAALLGTSLGGLGWTLFVVLTSLGLISLIGLIVLVTGKVGLALLVLAAYEERVPAGDRPVPAPLPQWVERIRLKNARITAWVLAVALLLAAGIWVVDLVDELRPGDAPELTAHRGSSQDAPENTLSALRRAIEDGADYAEIDVQTTSDGAVILQHDGDFMRVGGDPRKVADLTLEAVRTLDVGSWFSQDFAGEPVATLEEAIAVCRGRLRLNIELKYNRVDPSLAGRVGRILRAEAFTDQCIVLSLDWEPVRSFAAEFPEVKSGYIVFRSLGHLDTAKADAFSMNAAQMTAGLVRSIHRKGAEVHVWTVNDPRQALRMIEMDVDNLITDRPREMRSLLDEWVELTNSEKVALQLRRLLLPDETFSTAEL